MSIAVRCAYTLRRRRRQLLIACVWRFFDSSATSTPYERAISYVHRKMTIIRTFPYRRRVHTCIAGVLFKFEPWRQILSRQLIQQLFQHGGCLSSDRLPPPPPRRRYFPGGGNTNIRRFSGPPRLRAAALPFEPDSRDLHLYSVVKCVTSSFFDFLGFGFWVFFPANVRSHELEIATYVGDRFRTMILRVSRSKLAYGKDRLNAAHGVGEVTTKDERWQNVRQLTYASSGNRISVDGSLAHTDGTVLGILFDPVASLASGHKYSRLCEEFRYRRVSSTVPLSSSSFWV